MILGTPRNEYWAFLLPSVYPGKSDYQLALPALHPDFPQVAGETWREKAKANVLSRENGKGLKVLSGQKGW